MLTAYIGMGGNLSSPAGRPEATLTKAAERMLTLGRILSRSSLYSTEPVGLADQPRFINAVVALETDLAPRALLEGLLDLERAFGRDRSAGVQNGPRTLDLDILMMGDLCIHETGLDIPHPRLAERAFVLVPLHEIASNLVEPRHRKTIAELLRAVNEKGNDATQDVVQVHSDLWSSGAGADAAGSWRASGEPDTNCQG